MWGWGVGNVLDSLLSCVSFGGCQNTGEMSLQLVWQALFLLAHFLSIVRSANLRQPNTLKKDIHTVQIFGNDKYVDRQKYLRLLDALAKPAMGQVGLMTGVDFATMVKFDVTKVMASRVFVIPSLEFDNMATLDPEVKKVMKNYVESGHVVIMELTDPEGMDNGVTFLNEVYDLNLVGSAMAAGEDLQREDVDGFAWPFEKCPETLPYVDNIFGVSRASMPAGSYPVYTQGDSVGLFIIPFGSGLIMGVGLDYTAPDAPTYQGWRDVVRVAIDEGRFLDKIRLGMAVVRHQGSTFGKVEANGNWSHNGRDNLPPNGLKCVAWRKTLNCDPSGPRDFHGDKNCSAIVPQGESGFCECEGYVQTAAAPCNHRMINCAKECKFIAQRYKDLYGAGRKSPTIQDMHAVVQSAYNEHMERMMHKADVAVANVDAMTKAMKQAHDDVNAKLNNYREVPMWKQMADAGRSAEQAGKTVRDMASMAHPFLNSSEWTYPNSHPNPPPPPYSRYMPINPTYQGWLHDNIDEVKATPGPSLKATDAEPLG